MPTDERRPDPTIGSPAGGLITQDGLCRDGCGEIFHEPALTPAVTENGGLV
jgi:hypothetical protein